MKRSFLYTLCGIFAGGLLLWTGTSQALTFSGSSGSLAASADFVLSGNTLTVTLTNTSLADVLVPTDVLEGLYFNTTHTLTPVSASLNGSTVFYGSTSNLGDGWGYASGVSAQGKNSAISAMGAVNGLGHSNFSGANNPLQGLDYGILSAGDNSATGNTGVTGYGPLIKDSVQFTLTAGSGFALSELGDTVVFQYGTSLDETHFTANDPPCPCPRTHHHASSRLWPNQPSRIKEEVQKVRLRDCFAQVIENLDPREWVPLRGQALKGKYEL